MDFSASEWKLVANSGREQFSGSFLQQGSNEDGLELILANVSVAGDFWLDPPFASDVGSSGLESVFSVSLPHVVFRKDRIENLLDGGKTNSSPGRARHKPSNHCAGNAGVLRLYLYARVRTSLCSLHTRPRVQQAPGIPCSLSLEGKEFQQTSGAARRGKANVYLDDGGARTL